MKIKIIDLYHETQRVYDGEPEEMLPAISKDYDWAVERAEDPSNLDSILQVVRRAQFMAVRIEE